MRTAEQIADSINEKDETVFATAAEVQARIDSMASAAAENNPIAAMFAVEEPTRVEVLAARTAAKEKKMTIQFNLINAPSSSKGWLRIKAEAAGKPVIESRTGNVYVSANHSGEVEVGTPIILTVQTMMRSGKGRTAKETIYTETFSLIAEDGATCRPGSTLERSGMNGVYTEYLAGGNVDVIGARLA